MLDEILEQIEQAIEADNAVRENALTAALAELLAGGAA